MKMQTWDHLGIVKRRGRLRDCESSEAFVSSSSSRHLLRCSAAATVLTSLQFQFQEPRTICIPLKVTTANNCCLQTQLNKVKVEPIRLSNQYRSSDTFDPFCIQSGKSCSVCWVSTYKIRNTVSSLLVLEYIISLK